MVKFHTFIETLPLRGIVLIFGMLGDIADIITHDKFNVSRFRGFGVLIPPSVSISIELAGRSFNSVGLRTDVLHCDSLARELIIFLYSAQACRSSSINQLMT